MKSIIITISLLFAFSGIFAQNSKIDDIFNKFQDKEGITSVILTADLMKFASEVEIPDSTMNFLKNIKQVRILSFEKALAQDVVAFENMVKDVSLNNYKELMVVKEKNNNVRMLALEGQGRWNDFILIVTGGQKQALINVQGSISPKDLQGLSKSVHANGMSYVNKLK